jgi:ribose transport system permease protein
MNEYRAERLRAWLRSPAATDVILLAVLIVGFVAVVGRIQPAWFAWSTLQTAIGENSPLAIVAVAMTFSIISGNIDLSPGAMIALTGVIAGLVFERNGTLALGFLAGFGFAIAVGLVHATLVAMLRINAIIVTLAAYVWARGMAIGLTGANPVNINTPFINTMNTASFAGITIPIALAAGAYVLGWFLLGHTRMGRYTFALGRDARAAERAGISIFKLDLLIFGFMGFMIGVATVITVSQVAGAQPLEQQGFELDAIIAVIIGGSKLIGGEGSMVQTLMGVLFVTAINSGLANVGLTDAGYAFAKGTIILAALSLQVIVRRLVARRASRAERAGAPAMETKAAVAQ